MSGAGLVLGPGRVRGLVLHKLLEEMLGHELGQGPEAVERRAAELLRHLLPVPSEASYSSRSGRDGGDGAGGDAVAGSGSHLARPRPGGDGASARSSSQGSARPLAGRADAVMLDSEGGIALVVDWKSDVAPEANDIRTHEGQLALYLLVDRRTTGALVIFNARDGALG